MQDQALKNDFATLMPKLRSLLETKPPITPDEVASAYDTMAARAVEAVEHTVIGGYMTSRELIALMLGMDASMQYAASLAHQLSHEVPATIAAILFQQDFETATITAQLLDDLAATGRVLRTRAKNGSLTYELVSAGE